MSCIYRLAAVHLVDAHLCSDPAKYISALLLSLSTMLHLELPHVNLLSKIDLVEQYGKLHFNLDFYTEVRWPIVDAGACFHAHSTSVRQLYNAQFIADVQCRSDIAHACLCMVSNGLEHALTFVSRDRCKTCLT